MKHFLLLFALIAFTSISHAQDFKGCPNGDEKVTSSNISFEKQVLLLVNKERKKRGRKPLKWSEDLARAARYHAKDMMVDNYIDHDTYDRKRNGRKKQICDVFERMQKFLDQNVFACAENIAAGARTPEEVVKDWMTSSGHRQNVLAKDAKYLGVGFIERKGSEWGTYWVQCFGMDI